MNLYTDIFSKGTVGAMAIGAMLAFGADKAEAVSVTFDGGTGGNAGTVITGDGSVAQNNLASGSFQIDFRWNDTNPNYLAYSQFTTNSSFRLTFSDYSPSEDLLGAVGARSGFQIYHVGLDGLMPILGQIPGTEPPCGADVLTHFGSTDCVLITGPDNDPTAFVTPRFTWNIDGFGAGTYVLMFSEGNEPNNGTSEFKISAIPLPAGGVLLLTALGGMAALRRKRKDAA